MMMKALAGNTQSPLSRRTTRTPTRSRPSRFTPAPVCALPSMGGLTLPPGLRSLSAVLRPSASPDLTARLLPVCNSADSTAPAAVVPPATLPGGGDDGGTGNKDNNGGGGGGGGGAGPPGPGGKPLDPAIVALLAAAGRTVDSFPPEFAKALAAGKVPADILKRFLELEANFFVKLVWGIEGFRDRLLGDPYFPVKVAIECGIGVVTKVTAEKTKRGDAFWAEIDFVAANVVMAIIADFMLTWLPAPTLSYRPRVTAAATNPVFAYFANCPDNAFQRVPPGAEPFTLGQRVGAILRNGGKLLGVGFGASMLGVGLTNALIALRVALDPTWAPPNKPQGVLETSAAYGVYMSVSSNLRYQVIAGVIEERGIEAAFRSNPNLCHALSFVVRTANTFLGSLLWVDFVRLLGMQKSGGGH